jgi:hypothetical protein
MAIQKNAAIFDDPIRVRRATSHEPGLETVMNPSRSSSVALVFLTTIGMPFLHGYYCLEEDERHLLRQELNSDIHTSRLM